MAFVVRAGQLGALERTAAPAPYRLQLAPGLSQDYATIWRSQPEVRTVVDFLARNIAQLGLHLYRRVSDTDRERVTDHPAARLLERPNPTTTWYRMADALVHDLGIYDNAFWLKVAGEAGAPAGLVRLPPAMVSPLGEGWLAPDRWRIKGSRGHRDVPADQVVHFRGYNPDDARVGCSPIETLRRVLAEEHAATQYRDQLWRNGARIAGYLKRPAGAPAWSRDARERFRASWRAQYTGDGPQSGGTPVLEDGMEFVPAAVSPRDAQYVESRKLTREEVAAAYHIPLPMVGILDHATFSNIREQHRQLYQDTLGPWLTMLTQDIGLQLLGDLPDSDGLYAEFNLAEKLRGSFEEQAVQLQTSVGGPWMTRNEARSRMNLPAVDGGDELIVPLNVLEGGQASPTDSAPEPGQASRPRPRTKTAAAVRAKARPGDAVVAKAEETLKRFFERQSRTVLSRLGAKAAGEELLDAARWDAELAEDLMEVNTATAADVLARLRELFGVGEGELSLEVLLGWLQANAEAVATAVNLQTAAALTEAVDEAEDVLEAAAQVFKVAADARGPQIAMSQVTSIAGFTTEDAAGRVGYGRKRWITPASNPRKSHARLHGETVKVGGVFSNGGRWPGDSKLTPDERAGCTCDMELVRDEEDS